MQIKELEKLPPDIQREVADFAEFLLEKRGLKQVDELRQEEQ